jgi:hypothetical protein
MALTVQNLRAIGTGVEPASLLPGQICFNLTDKVLYVGDGSNFKTSFDGTQVAGVPGNGWYSMPMDFSSLGDYYVANPLYWGDVPTDQQVLTWSSALNHPIWTNGGGGGGGNQVYVITNAEVAAAPGGTTSAKITAAIGVASPDEGDVTIVTGLPDDVYEGLYFFTTEWVKGAAYAYPSASEVIYDNTAHPDLSATVQGAIDDLDDGLAATTAIANTANSTANSALSIASAALPRSGGTMTGTLVTRNIDVQTGYNIQFANGASGTLTGISDSTILVSSTVAASASALTATNIIASAALPRAGGTMTGNITFANSGEGIVFSNGTFVTGISSSVSLASATTAASSAALKTAYDIAVAAIPRASYTAQGDLLVGAGPGTFGALGVGLEDQILAVGPGGTLRWVAQSEGDVTTVSGIAPITVDNLDPQNPVIGVDLATTATPGVVQVELTGNLTLVGGVINVPNASTTVKGAVQLYDSTSGGTSSLALTASAGAALQSQITSLTLAGNVTLAGGYNAVTGVVDGVTTQGAGVGFIDGAAPPAAAAGNADYYLICTVAGSNPSTMENGDWLLSDGTAYLVLGVGARPDSASYIQAGIVQLADAASVEIGTSDTTAITPQSLQDNVIDSVTTANSSLIASATAVKTANDNAVAAQATANAALPKAGGTMTGNITFQDSGEGVIFSDSSAVAAISDSTSTTSSTTAASSTAVKSAYDLADAALPETGGTMTGDIVFSGAGNGVVFDDSSTIEAISDSTSLTSSTTAASSTALSAVSDVADAAIPCSVLTACGDILVAGFGAVPTALPIGADGQVLVVNSTCATGLEWVTDTPGDVTSVTGSAPVTVDNTDPQNPIVGISAASTTACGAVQLNNTVSSSSTTQAATANVVKTTYDLANAAIPCSSFVAKGNLLSGTGSGTYSALTVGTNGQFLSANSACGTGLEWCTLSLACVPCSAYTAAGTILAGNGAGTYCSLPVGTSGQVLVPNSSCAAGVAWTTLSPLSICGYTCTATPFNTAIGANAGDSVTSGTDNVAIGFNAGTAITTGGQNIAIGRNALQVATSATGNVAIGHQALTGASASQTTAVGFNALSTLTSGVRNTAVGFFAGGSVTTGTDNTFIGFGAGDSNTGSASTLVGANAGNALTLGGSNVFIGANAGDSVTTGFNNTIIGDVSGSSSLVGNLILAAGTTIKFQANDSGAWSPDGTNYGTSGQVLASQGSGAVPVWCTLSLACIPCAAFTSAGQLLAGTGAGTFTALTVGTNGQFLVADSACTGGLKWSTECFVNDSCYSSKGAVLAGTGAGTFSALPVGINGQFLVADSTCATGLKWATECFVDDSSFTGTGAILAGTGVGSFAALPVGSSGQFLTVDSTCANGIKWVTADGANICGFTCSSGNFSVALGFQAGAALTPTGFSNVFVGYNAGCQMSGGDYNVAVGNSSLQGTGSSNVAIGAGAMGQTASTGNNNVAIGYQSADALTSGANNIAIGQGSLGASTTASDQVAVGHQAGCTNTTGAQSVYVGSNAGLLSNSVGSTFIGFGAGCSNTNSGCTTYVGYVSGRNATGLSNTYVGALTGCAASNASACGTLLGFCAGSALTTGNGNILVGFQAGRNVNSGANNVVIGTAAFQTATTAASNVAVGCGALAGLSSSAGNTALGHRAMINASTAANNVVIGCSAGEQISTGSTNVFVGNTAGDAVTIGSNNTIIGDIAGSTTLTNNLILAAGTTIKLQVNENGAVGVGTTPSYGTAGQILVSGGSGAAPTWTTSAALPANYGSFLSTVSQTNLDTTNGNAATFNTTTENRNVSVQSNSRLTVTTAGTYNIQFSAQMTKTDGGSDDINIWFKRNGVNVANSASNITLVGNNTPQLATVNFILTLAANDYVEIWWYSPDANVILLAEPAATPYPAIPSIIATVVPVGA